MLSLIKRIKTYLKQHKTQSKLDERYLVDWVNFQKTIPPVRFWERVRGHVIYCINFTLFVMLITGLTYALIISAERGANKKYCSILQDGGLTVIEDWHPTCN